MPAFDEMTDEVRAGRIRFRSSGMRGTVEQLPAGAPSRGGGPTDRAFLEAFVATGVEVVDQVRIDAVANDETASYEVDVPSVKAGFGQILLVVDDDGRRRWVTDPGSPMPPPPGTRAPGTTTWSLPADPAPREDGTPASRGVWGWAVKKVVKVLTFKLIGKVGELAANHFASQWEKTAHPYVLRRYGPDDHRLQVDASLGEADLAACDGKPTLLVLHGIMSRSHSASGFGALPTDLVADFHTAYEGRVLSFDHPTVSVGPKANVVELYRALGDVRPQFDLLCHSRGGLVARLLADGPAPAGASPVHVRSVVMAGTPNAGTPLADAGYLGRLVDVFTNLLDKVPDNPFTDTAGIIISVVKQLAVGAVDGLDGLACLGTGSSLLAELNGPVTDAARFRAIASNFEPKEGSGLGLVARDLAIDLLMRSANDLLVPAEGVSRAGDGNFSVADPFVLVPDLHVQHSTYWSSTDVGDYLRAQLLPPS